jgi:hypothetical protein
VKQRNPALRTTSKAARNGRFDDTSIAAGILPGHIGCSE